MLVSSKHLLKKKSFLIWLLTYLGHRLFAISLFTRSCHFTWNVLRINDRTTKKVATVTCRREHRGVYVELGPLPGKVHLVIYRRVPITVKPHLKDELDRM